jgi:hypothetical protein
LPGAQRALGDFPVIALLVFGYVLCLGAEAKAQPHAPPASPPPAQQTKHQPKKEAAPLKGETPATVLDGGNVSNVLGMQVRDAAGHNMGRIIDLLADRNGDVRAAIIDFGGFLGVGTRKVAVDWHALHFPSKGRLDNATLTLGRDAVTKAPEYKPGEPIVVLQSTRTPAPPPKAAAPKPAVAKAPPAKTPLSKNPETKNPEAKNPEPRTPDVKAPEPKTSGAKAPAVKTPPGKAAVAKPATGNTPVPKTPVPDTATPGATHPQPQGQAK